MPSGKFFVAPGAYAILARMIMHEQFAVRLIQEADIASFHAALGSVCREQKYLSFTDAPPLESTGEFILENIRNDVPQYVAVDNGRVIGWCDICPLASRPVYAHTGVLGMAVVAEARGRGIGRRLITTTLDHAKAAGLVRIELEVYTSNERAIKLYESLGFEIEGTKRMRARFPDRYEDAHIMALFFAD